MRCYMLSKIYELRMHFALPSLPIFSICNASATYNKNGCHSGCHSHIRSMPQSAFPLFPHPNKLISTPLPLNTYITHLLCLNFSSFSTFAPFSQDLVKIVCTFTSISHCWNISIVEHKCQINLLTKWSNIMENIYISIINFVFSFFLLCIKEFEFYRNFQDISAVTIFFLLQIQLSLSNHLHIYPFSFALIVSVSSFPNLHKQTLIYTHWYSNSITTHSGFCDRPHVRASVVYLLENVAQTRSKQVYDSNTLANSFFLFVLSRFFLSLCALLIFSFPFALCSIYCLTQSILFQFHKSSCRIHKDISYL